LFNAGSGAGVDLDFFLLCAFCEPHTTEHHARAVAVLPSFPTFYFLQPVTSPKKNSKPSEIFGHWYGTSNAPAPLSYIPVRQRWHGARGGVKCGKVVWWVRGRVGKMNKISPICFLKKMIKISRPDEADTATWSSY
jgi:hypothetical protein